MFMNEQLSGMANLTNLKSKQSMQLKTQLSLLNGEILLWHEFSNQMQLSSTKKLFTTWALSPLASAGRPFYNHHGSFHSG